MKILLAVDGSEPSIRATRKLIETLDWYKETPQVELVTVHLPTPHVGGIHAVVSEHDIERYYAEESAENLAGAVKVLDEAGIAYTVRTLVGPIGETIAKQAAASHSDVIYMGTHGRRGVAAFVLGSVAMDLIQRAPVPVVLIR